MEILYLTNPSNPPDAIESIVRRHAHGDIGFITRTDPVSCDELRASGVQLVIKDKYHHPFAEGTFELGIDIVSFAPTYMPYNKGDNSNLWSFIDDTPKGGSIYYMRDEWDYGTAYPLYLVDRFHVESDPADTLRSSFDSIYAQIYSHFDGVCADILAGRVSVTRFDEHQGTFHSRAETEPFLKSLELGYDTKVSEIKALWATFCEREP